MSGWNPRYIAYVTAQGSASVEEQRARDAQRYPGGPMCGFIVWIAEKWQSWREERGIRPDDPLSDADHADFDVWLAERSGVDLMEAVG